MTDSDSNFFKENFPNLYEEIEDEENVIPIDGVERNQNGENEEKPVYDEGKEEADPDVVDFLRLCDDDDEAEEIIEYMEAEGKIDSNEAGKLRTQLDREGVRSFGAKRRPGEYPVEEEESE